MKNIEESKDVIPIGLDPKLFPPERLFYWLTKPRNPVLASSDPLTLMFIQAWLTTEPVEFIYLGGTNPAHLGKSRSRWYLSTRRKAGFM